MNLRRAPLGSPLTSPHVGPLRDPDQPRFHAPLRRPVSVSAHPQPFRFTGVSPLRTNYSSGPRLSTLTPAPRLATRYQSPWSGVGMTSSAWGPHRRELSPMTTTCTSRDVSPHSAQYTTLNSLWQNLRPSEVAVRQDCRSLYDTHTRAHSTRVDGNLPGPPLASPLKPSVAVQSAGGGGGEPDAESLNCNTAVVHPFKSIKIAISPSKPLPNELSLTYEFDLGQRVIVESGDSSDGACSRALDYHSEKAMRIRVKASDGKSIARSFVSLWDLLRTGKQSFSGEFSSNGQDVDAPVENLRFRISIRLETGAAEAVSRPSSPLMSPSRTAPAMSPARVPPLVPVQSVWIDVAKAALEIDRDYKLRSRCQVSLGSSSGITRSLVTTTTEGLEPQWAQQMAFPFNGETMIKVAVLDVDDEEGHTAIGVCKLNVAALLRTGNRVFAGDLPLTGRNRTSAGSVCVKVELRAAATEFARIVPTAGGESSLPAQGIVAQRPRGETDDELFQRGGGAGPAVTGP